MYATPFNANAMLLNIQRFTDRPVSCPGQTRLSSGSSHVYALMVVAASAQAGA
jgi:hypothetical protein